MNPDLKNLVLTYFERGGCITVGKYKRPKKSDRTFRNDRGSVFNAGRNIITMRKLGYKSRSAASA